MHIRNMQKGYNYIGDVDFLKIKIKTDKLILY